MFVTHMSGTQDTGGRPALLRCCADGAADTGLATAAVKHA